MIDRAAWRPYELGRRLLRAGASLADVLLPAGCAVCGVAVPGDRPPLCALCSSRVRSVPSPLCPRCGATRLIDLGDDDRCPECAAWPIHLRAAAACLHHGVAAHLVRGLKYRGYTALAPYLGARMLPAALRLAGRRCPLLVPVPLAPARLRERGFNQAELLARAIASRTGWRVARLLSRPSGGPALARRGRRDRETLAGSAYALNTGVTGRSIRRVPLLLVDDVITTGSTASACVELLVGAGATCLGAVCFTRTTAALDRT